MVRVEEDVEQGVAARIRGLAEPAVALDPQGGPITTGELDIIFEPVDHHRVLIAEEGDDHPASRGRLEATKLDLKLDSRVLTGPEGRRPVEEVVHEVEVEGNNGRRVQGGIDERVKFRVIEKDGNRPGRPRLECGRANALPFERGRTHPADVAHEVAQTVIT